MACVIAATEPSKFLGTLKEGIEQREREVSLELVESTIESIKISEVHAEGPIDTCHEDYTGLVAWPVTRVFCSYICANEAVQERIRDKAVVEVGSGTGLLGLVAAHVGARKTVLTDLPKILPLTHRNVSLNDDTIISKVVVEACPWGDSDAAAKVAELAGGRVDTILASEVFYGYRKEVTVDLVRTLGFIAHAGRKEEDEPLRLLVASQSCWGWMTSNNRVKDALRDAGWTLETTTSLLDWDMMMDDAAVYGRQVDCFRAPAHGSA